MFLTVAAALAAALLALASPASAASVVNGDFETGTLSGFTVVNQEGGSGNWFAYSSASPPVQDCTIGSPPQPPPQGTFAATTAQSFPGSHVLYQDIRLEPDARHTLSFTLYYRNSDPFLFATPDTLDYTARPNQQYRVDILKPSADPFSVASADVLANIFRTDVGEPNTLSPTPMTFDLSRYAGQRVRLRFAEVDNLGCLLASVDNIDLRTRRRDPPPRPRPRPGLPQPPSTDCTITRGSGNDVIRGTPGRDVICAGAGNDVVYGRGGNDVIRGGGGNDILRGGEGNDRLIGGPGRDVLYGNAGADSVDTQDAGRGNDAARGGAGADSCATDRRDVRSSC